MVPGGGIQKRFARFRLGCGRGRRSTGCGRRCCVGCGGSGRRRCRWRGRSGRSGRGRCRWRRIVRRGRGSWCNGRGRYRGCGLFFVRGTLSDIRKIGAQTHFSQCHRPGKNVIARCAAALAPFAFDIGPGIIRPDLFAVAIHTAVAHINMAATNCHAGRWLRIDIVLVIGAHLRVKMAYLRIWNNR